MTPEQIKLIRDNWNIVYSHRDNAAKVFYNKLFELDPKVKKLFKTPMQEQGKKLMAIIHMVVNSLDKLENIIDKVKELGERHTTYGVKKDDYETVGVALLWTLEHVTKNIAKEEFTYKTKLAWTIAYTTLSSVMKDPFVEGAMAGSQNKMVNHARRA